MQPSRLTNLEFLTIDRLRSVYTCPIYVTSKKNQRLLVSNLTYKLPFTLFFSPLLLKILLEQDSEPYNLCFRPWTGI